MSDLLHIVKGLSVQPKCVLVLGARTETTLNWLFALTATQVILVEPEPALFEKATILHKAKGSPESVIIKHGVPSLESDQKSTRYFVSNVPGYSSVCPPNVIKSIRPALEFTEQEVPVIELTSLLQQFEISESRPCLLISQLNGAEQQCLTNQLLNAFTHVLIQSSLKPIFGESKPAEKLKKEFTECGRDYLELAETMPPYSNFLATKKVNAEQALNYFSQRQQHREIKAELENQLSASQSDAKKLAEELQQAREQLQTTKQQSEEKQKQLGGELQQAREQLQTTKQQSEEKQKQLSEELRQVQEQLKAANRQTEEKQKELREELEQTKQQADEKQKLLTEEHEKARHKNKESELDLLQKVKILEKEIHSVSLKLEHETHWHNEHKVWNQGLKSENDTLKKALDFEKEKHKDILSSNEFLEEELSHANRMLFVLERTLELTSSKCEEDEKNKKNDKKHLILKKFGVDVKRSVE